MTNKAASQLAHMRWSKLSPQERNETMTRVREHGTGRKRVYPPCERYKNRAHRFPKGKDLCPCGYRRNV